MADRYQRYTSKGLALRMPTIDFTFAQTRANNLGNLSNNINKMSEMFFNRAVETAKIEGAEYGALNAPTNQQLIDANKSGQDLEFVGDKDTIFGKYARTATLQATSDKLTLIAKQSISDIMLTAQRDNVEPSEVAKQLDSVVSGLSDVLDNESPSTSLKFKANLGVYSNAEYKTYTSKFITEKQNELRTQFNLNADATITNVLPKIIQAGQVKQIPTDIKKDGKTVYEKETIATTFETIQSLKANLLAGRPSGMKTAEVLALSKRFDDAVLQYSKDIINEAIFKNEEPQKLIDAIESGKINTLPMAMQSAFSVVRGEDKALLKSIAQKAIDDKISRETTKINFANTKRENFIKVVEINASQALRNTNKVKALKDYEDAILQMQKLSPKKADEMRELLKENPSLKYEIYSDRGTFDSISMKFNDQDLQLKQYQLNNLLLTGKLNKSDYDDFTDKLTARSDKEFNKALSYARSKLNIPKSFINIGGQQNDNLAILKNIEEAMYKERAYNPDFLPMQWVEENYDTYRAKGKDVEVRRIKNLAGDYFTKEALDKKINSTPRKINNKPNPFYQKLVDDRNEILQFIRDNPDKLITNYDAVSP